MVKRKKRRKIPRLVLLDLSGSPDLQTGIEGLDNHLNDLNEVVVALRTSQRGIEILLATFGKLHFATVELLQQVKAERETRSDRARKANATRKGYQVLPLDILDGTLPPTMGPNGTPGGEVTP
jgi:hypothetical protein